MTTVSNATQANSLDALTNTPMTIGTVNATTINVGRTLQNVAIAGTASVAEAFTATTSVTSPSITGTSTTSGFSVANNQTGGTCSSVVNINTGTGASQSSTTNIGTGTTTGTVTIGNTNNTTAIASPLTYASTIGSSYSSLPSLVPANIGYSYLGSFPATLPTTGSTLSSVTISTGGVYLFMFAIQVNCSLNPTTFYLSLSFSGLATGYSPMNSTNFTCQLTQYFTKSDNTTVTYNLIPTYSGGTGPFNVSNSFLRAVKIA